MRAISMSMTVEQFLDGSKDVTRRLGWKFLKTGDTLRVVRKAMGLKLGEKAETLGYIKVVSVRRERLDEITPDDVRREGFLNWSHAEFVEFFCKAMKVTPGTIVTRIEFEQQEIIAEIPAERAVKGMWWGEGWQLVEGCTPVSEGCDNCWSLEKESRFKCREKWPAEFADRTVACFESRLQKPLKRKKPTVFAIWNDLFHEDVPFEFIDKVFAVMAVCPQHVFIICTKRPRCMRAYFCDIGGTTRRDWVFSAVGRLLNACKIKGFSWPLSNVILMTTAENKEQADKRIPVLLKCPAACRAVSIEPMLSEFRIPNSEIRNLDWVILGGESGPHARPMHPDWVKKVRDDCQNAGVPFWFKQWGEWMPVDEPWKQKSPKLLATNERWLNFAGGSGFHGDNVWRMRRGCKKKAGRTLDGQEYNETPELIGVEQGEKIYV